MGSYRIGLVIDRLGPARGGAEGYLLGLARFLGRRGHEVHFLAQHFDPGVDTGVLHTVAASSLPRGFRELAFDRAAARHAAQLGLDVTLGVRHTPSTHVFQPHGGVYSRAVQAQSRSAGRFGPVHALARAWLPKHRVLLHLESLQRRARDRVALVALSRKVQADMVEVYGLGAHPEPTLLYNGVDTDRFRPDPVGRDRARIRAVNQLEEDAFVVLFMAHNFRLKGLRHVLDALAIRKAPGTRLLVVGRGRVEPVQRRARQLGLEGTVRFVRETDQPEHYYRAADVLAHPTYYDPCSCVCLEALASGLPVITTRANGVGELMAGAGGGVVLADAADAAGLGEALQRFREDHAFWRMHAEAARRLAEAHPENQAFAGLEAVLVEAAKRRS